VGESVAPGAVGGGALVGVKVATIVWLDGASSIAAIPAQ